MPRPSQSRAFGFKVDGLVRILTAADPDEVLKALLILDLDPRDPEIGEAFDFVIEEAVGLITRGFLETIDFMVNVAQEVDRLVASVEKLSPREIERDTERYQEMLSEMSRSLRGEVFLSKDMVVAIRKKFSDRMQLAKAKFPNAKFPEYQAPQE